MGDPVMSVTDAQLVEVTHATRQSQTPHRRRSMDVEILSIVTLRVCVCPRSFVAVAIRGRAVTLSHARHGRSPPWSCRCGGRPLSRQAVAMVLATGVSRSGCWVPSISGEPERLYLR